MSVSYCKYTYYRFTAFIAILTSSLLMLSCSSGVSNAPHSPTSHTDRVTLSAQIDASGRAPQWSSRSALRVSPRVIDSNTPTVDISYVNVNGMVTHVALPLDGSQKVIEARFSSTVTDNTIDLKETTGELKLVTDNATEPVPANTESIAITYKYASSTPPSLPKGRGVVVYFNPKQDTGTFATQLATLIQKIGNVQYVYLDGFELATTTSEDDHAYKFYDENRFNSQACKKCNEVCNQRSDCKKDKYNPNLDPSCNTVCGVKPYKLCTVHISDNAATKQAYKTIVAKLKGANPKLKILLMSNFSSPGDGCNVLSFSDPQESANNLFNIANKIGVDGIAIDYEPVAVNQAYESYTPASNPKISANNPKIYSFDDFVTHVFYKNRNANTITYLSELRKQTITLANGKGLFALVAGKSAFYNQQYNSAQNPPSWSFQATPIISNVLSKPACKGQCFASLMFYDASFQGESDSLYSLIGALSTGFNIDKSAGLPGVLQGVPFRLMLPLAYSDNNYFNPITDKGYTYAGFLCDMSAFVKKKWLSKLNNVSGGSCQTDTPPTYLPDTTGKVGIDNRPLLSISKIKPSWNTPTLDSHLKTITELITIA